MSQPIDEGKQVDFEGKELDVEGKQANEKSGLPRDDEENASLHSTSTLGKGDILSLEHTDPVLNAKMHLINDVRAAICCVGLFCPPSEDQS